MNKSQQLDRIAGNLDDLSITLEEIKEDVKATDAVDIRRLDEIQTEMEKATDMIEESIDPGDPED